MSGRTDRTPVGLMMSGARGGESGLRQRVCVDHLLAALAAMVHGQLAAFLMLPSCCSSAGLDECCAYAVQYSCQRALKVLEDNTHLCLIVVTPFIPAVHAVGTRRRE